MLISIYFILPESPSYLVANKKYEECYNVLKKIARVNGTTDHLFSKEKFLKQVESNNNNTIDKHFDQLEEITNFHEIQSLLNIKKKIVDERESDEQEAKNNASIIYFLLNPIKNLWKTMLMCYVWISLTMIYFGVSLGKLIIFI